MTRRTSILARAALALGPRDATGRVLARMAADEAAPPAAPEDRAEGDSAQEIVVGAVSERMISALTDMQTVHGRIQERMDSGDLEGFQKELAAMKLLASGMIAAVDDAMTYVATQDPSGGGQAGPKAARQAAAYKPTDPEFTLLQAARWGVTTGVKEAIDAMKGGRSSDWTIQGASRGSLDLTSPYMFKPWGVDVRFQYGNDRVVANVMLVHIDDWMARGRPEVVKFETTIPVMASKPFFPALNKWATDKLKTVQQ
jgi:hypothetical protein